MMREVLYWQECYMKLDALTVYRGILRDKVVKLFMDLCHVMAYDPDMTDVSTRYYEFLTAMLVKADELGLKGNLLRKYFIHLYLNDENIYTMACERNNPVANTSLHQMAMRDINTLHYLCEFDFKNVSDNVGAGENITQYTPIADREDPYIEEVEKAGPPIDKMKSLMWRYQRMGAGNLAGHTMFKISGKKYKLTPVSYADEVVFSDIIGLERQKETLINNTKDFITGRPANNVLLAGSRGCGKSSCVKALVNAYADRGLRLIEARKDQVALLPGLMSYLAKRGKYFIIFMDDLSYEHFETQYKYLKSMLEGSAEAKPKNVLIYATSNRRHIIRESWDDRTEHPSDGEIHTTDTVNEKLSLFDRFGLTITFPNFSQDEYLKVVKGMAAKRNLVIDPAFLADQAIKWSLVQKSMSGRTARQFVDHIAGEMAKV